MLGPSPRSNVWPPTVATLTSVTQLSVLRGHNSQLLTKWFIGIAAAMLLGVLTIPYYSSLTKLSLRAFSLPQTLKHGIAAWLSISEGIFVAMRSQEKSLVL